MKPENKGNSNFDSKKLVDSVEWKGFQDSVISDGGHEDDVLIIVPVIYQETSLLFISKTYPVVSLLSS